MATAQEAGPEAARTQAILNDFFRRVPQGQSEHARDGYHDDRSVLQTLAQPSAKQLPPRDLDLNYFHQFLQYWARTDDALAEDTFMLAKLEAERFHQWAGPAGVTLTQVTPTAASIPDAAAAFDQALANVFSAALKPLNGAAFSRAVKCRFRVSRFVAHTHGPEGLFRADVANTSVLQRFDRPADIGTKQGRFAFGSIVLVLVHHQLLRAEHAVFALAAGPFKHGASPDTPTPTHLTARTAVNWAPGVDFSAVEAWWRDAMTRPSLRCVAAADAAAGPQLRAAGLRVPAARPMACGARMLRAALAEDASALRAAVRDRACESPAAPLAPISDEDLLYDAASLPLSLASLDEE